MACLFNHVMSLISYFQSLRERELHEKECAAPRKRERKHFFFQIMIELQVNPQLYYNLFTWRVVNDKVIDSHHFCSTTHNSSCE